jgi:hypothetical protein
MHSHQKTFSKCTSFCWHLHSQHHDILNKFIINSINDTIKKFFNPLIPFPINLHNKCVSCHLSSTCSCLFPSTIICCRVVKDIDNVRIWIEIKWLIKRDFKWHGQHIVIWDHVSRSIYFTGRTYTKGENKKKLHPQKRHFNASNRRKLKLNIPSSTHKKAEIAL